MRDPSSKLTPRPSAQPPTQIIGSIQTPLAPELPSIPSSSSRKLPSSDNSFASSSKRKLDSNVESYEGSAKRAKPTAVSSPALGHGTARTSSQPFSDPAKSSSPPESYGSSATAYTSKLPESERLAGEVTNVGAVPSRSPTLFEPVRRPRRGLASIDFKSLQTFYYNQARNFKYSGEGRFLSAHPPSHERHKPLRDPPPKGSPYHTHSTLMAALEALEGLISFVYSQWCQEFCNSATALESWNSIHQYLGWVRSKWDMYVGPRDNVREKAFLGLM